MKSKTKNMKNNDDNDTSTKTSEVLDYCGIKSSEGKPKMRSKYHIKKQALMHTLTVKEQKRKRKLLKKQKQIKLDRLAKRNKVKPKQVRKKVDLEEIKFNQLIDEYHKECTASSHTTSKTKWYDT